MPQLWLYSTVIFVQPGEGKGGLANHDVAIDHRIDSFEIRDAVKRSIEEDLFPDGPPDLPEHVQPVVLLSWTLLSAKQGSGVEPLTPKDNGNSH